jgi:hypothetical protein
MPHARTFFLFGSRDAFAVAAVNFAYAAGWGHARRASPDGRSAMVSGIWLQDEPGGGHPREVLVCFKPHPPYAHFKNPGG